MFFSIIILSISAALIYAVLFVGRRGRNFPHGPPTLPLIGNLHQMPTKRAHLKFTEWAKQYGGIYSLKLGTGTAVVLTDRRLIKQLVDKKSSIYSNRPPSYVGEGLITSGDHLLIMNYGDLWRSFRKIIHQYVMESMVEKEHTMLVNAEAVQMIRDFCVAPEQHMLHPKRFSNSIIMSLLYGVRTPSVETRHMKKLYELMEKWSKVLHLFELLWVEGADIILKVMEPGNTPPVDIFPFLHWVPERFLGMWVSRAKNVSKEMNGLYAEYLNLVIKRRKEEGSRESFMDKVLDQNEKLNFNHHQLYFLGGVMMEGGSDTSSSIIIAFIHAMTKWPEVQKKAQQEIDAVVGDDRSPVWSDYSKLPYVAQTVKESMRWRPVVPLAFPHALAEDDWIDGRFLPKGTTVFINAFGLPLDEQRFPNPETFDPDHYAGVTALAPELAAAADYESRDHYGYGSGRRLCPGIHLAERNLFLAISKLLWGFSIMSGHDASGNAIEPDVSNETGYSEGFLVCAHPFAAKVTPRSEARRATIMREFKNAEVEVFSKYQVPAV
ncbi:hypothetical protein LTR16_000571 [Cryomyces antarcticus]|uniref:Cytochrome P450 n=1 Tax=Cryomyces antarcticus TaxID=329879 RepID=A0ABR0KUL3_9PEZI|nr:hypothetical protein LTR39_000409 [Cryomyces antarcticus]KAK5020757.1 hypothetical protein LTR60_000257 [Cryomyces antarcticus]KAK5131632.1 hypothetical protein LTR16_000571 [Cryomyces antarcticus]